MSTSVYIRMENNVAEQSFQLYCTKKPFFIFRVRKIGFFVKHLPKICCKMGDHHFYKILDHISCTNNQMVVSEKLSIQPFPKRQIPADSVETGSNLNYRCFIVCSWFFEKLISRYASRCFIIDAPRVSQNSTPRYERSRPPFWPYFEIGA